MLKVYECECGAWVKVKGEELIPPSCPVCNGMMHISFFGTESEVQIDIRNLQPS